ncbi:PepSY domain-containing protein [Methylomonas sp. OY6]|uniref:PepSY domain-containing protein n=1 Tax=Methylomonas defluvii TaxID=3045149 RepID=A0ABU4UKT3_9GAMM|nr:PepSY domain-containing protein [Methylomonas sp. OY6]MDX8129400.1 PepSY domain-containing protein [Methylomonas sp. OY6]
MKKIDWRHWHAWLSVLLSIPAFLVGMTAILIAHNKTLGLNGVSVDVGWLPGLTPNAQAAPDIRSTLSLADGRRFIGGKAGLFVLENNKLTAVSELAGYEIRSLAANPNNVAAAGNRGVWLNSGGNWRQIYRQAAHSVQIGDDGIIRIATQNSGLLFSDNSGANWRPDAATLKAFEQLPAEALREDYSVGKLILDVHTGKAFLGKHWEWLWIDLLGGLLVFLCLSGVYLWWRGQQRKAALLGKG